jgi:hypothetical protein
VSSPRSERRCEEEELRPWSRNTWKQSIHLLMSIDWAPTLCQVREMKPLLSWANSPEGERDNVKDKWVNKQVAFGLWWTMKTKREGDMLESRRRKRMRGRLSGSRGTGEHPFLPSSDSQRAWTRPKAPGGKTS